VALVLLFACVANMKFQVTDAQVAEYTARLRTRSALGKVFPGPMSDCEFTAAQREEIRVARGERKAAQKNGKAVELSETHTTKESVCASPAANSPVKGVSKTRALSKLEKMLYLQSDRCFFCGEVLEAEEASIEHLNPKCCGGTSDEDNEVVCHKSLNDAFGSMGLKAKFAFVLRSAGAFKCPKT
jgi:hypothetical protein